MSKYEKDKRYNTNYDKIINTAQKRGIAVADLAKMAGKSRTYFTTMKNNNSKMLYSDLITVARILGIHGANYLVLEPKEERADVVTDTTIAEDIDKDIMEEMKANMTLKERRTEALEAIAGSLIELNELLRELKGGKR